MDTDLGNNSNRRLPSSSIKQTPKSDGMGSVGGKGKEAAGLYEYSPGPSDCQEKLNEFSSGLGKKSWLQLFQDNAKKALQCEDVEAEKCFRLLRELDMVDSDEDFADPKWNYTDSQGPVNEVGDDCCKLPSEDSLIDQHVFCSDQAYNKMGDNVEVIGGVSVDDNQHGEMVSELHGIMPSKRQMKWGPVPCKRRSKRLEDQGQSILEKAQKLQQQRNLEGRPKPRGLSVLVKCQNSLEETAHCSKGLEAGLQGEYEAQDGSVLRGVGEKASGAASCDVWNIFSNEHIQ